MTTANLVEAAYENHRSDVARREADYTRELNAKLGQINAQAKTIMEIVGEIQQAIDVLRMQDNAGKGQSHAETIRRAAQALNILDAALANVQSYTLQIGRTK